MLLIPFVAATLLARRATVESLAAAVALVAVFLAREPLVILWRQARVWKERRPEARQARAWLAMEGAAAAGAGVFLFLGLPAVPLLLMGGAAAALTLYSAWMTVHNRQRSVALQLASAAGLTLAAPLAWLAARGNLAPAAWWLAALLFVHSASGVLVVHARLDRRIAASRGAMSARTYWKDSWNRALWAQGAGLALALACVLANRPWLSVAPLFSAAAHVANLAGMRHAEALRTPLQQVGRRALAVSLVYCAIAIAALSTPR